MPVSQTKEYPLAVNGRAKKVPQTMMNDGGFFTKLKTSLFVNCAVNGPGQVKSIPNPLPRTVVW
jgi:hypothetical protein